MIWLLRIIGALTAPTSMALSCRWRSRPQHQLRTKKGRLDHDEARYAEGRNLRETAVTQGHICCRCLPGTMSCGSGTAPNSGSERSGSHGHLTAIGSAIKCEDEGFTMQ